MIVHGRSISPGVARGKTLVIGVHPILDAALDTPSHASPVHEMDRFGAAVNQACVQIDRLKRQIRYRVSDQDLSILDTHAGLIRDAKFAEQVQNRIERKGRSAESAISEHIRELFARLRSSKIPAVQDKASDVLDVGRRLLQCISASPEADQDSIRGAVVVATSLTPSELISYAHRGAVAFITNVCGPRSHTAVLARGLGLPLVSEIGCVTDVLPDQHEIFVDADAGLAVLVHSLDEKGIADDIQRRIQITESQDAQVPDGVPRTADGQEVHLLLNVSDETEVSTFRDIAAPGVGLLRTEFMYMGLRSWPSEDEFYRMLRRIATAAPGPELNIRLADFGAEKCPEYSDIPAARNPGLGLRGLRLLLQRSDILEPHLRALARLARERRFTLLLPMLDTVSTLHSAIERFCTILRVGTPDELPFGLGAMIECPSAALTIEDILPHVESVSIGLNDLTQYVLAVDRDDETVERYHDPLQPAVVRLVDRMCEVASAHDKKLTVCGDFLGNRALIAVLMACGVRRFSIYRSGYAGLGDLIRRLYMYELEAIRANLLVATDSSEILKIINPLVCKEPGSTSVTSCILAT